MILLLVFYVVIHSPTGDQVREYDGMDKATVEQLAGEQGDPVDFISESSYTLLTSQLHRNSDGL